MTMETPMSIDDILAEHKKWIGTIAEQAANGRASEAQLKYPDELRLQRMTDLQASIDSLVMRKDDMMKSYEKAIAQDQQELEALKASQNSPIPKMDSNLPMDKMGSGQAAASSAKGKRQK
jgi:ribosomal protein L16 Arg81 hydroxylase